MELKSAVAFTLLWLALPLILLGIVLFARFIVNRTSEGEPHLAAQAGFLAGLVATVALVVFHVDRVEATPVSGFSVSLNHWSFLAAASFGYVLVYILRRLIPTRLVGLVVLLLTFAGTSSLYGALFIGEISNAVISGTLGLAFGVLVHAMLHPKSIAEFFPGDATWLESLGDFQRRETLRQVEFKRSHWPELPDGLWSEPALYPYPHVLPEGHLGKAFYPPMVADLAGYCRERRISIQSEGLNLLNPRVACLNFVFPLRMNLDLAARALAPLLPDVTKVSRVEFDWAGDDATARWLGEPTNGAPHQRRTAADVAVWWEGASRKNLTLADWHYTERGFGACDGFQSRGNQHKHLCLGLKVASPDASEQCYLGMSNGIPPYWGRLGESGVSPAALSAVKGCPFRGPFFRLLRLQLLAAYHRMSPDADRVDAAIIGFRGNKSNYNQLPDYLRPLGHTITAAWNRGLAGVPELKHVNVEDIIAAVRADRSGEAQALASYLGDRYGL